METTSASRRRTISLAIATGITGLLGLGFFSLAPEPILVAQIREAPGVIAGSVTADRGEVRAFRVKARDTVHRITYTVFTNQGRYQIHDSGVPPARVR